MYEKKSSVKLERDKSKNTSIGVNVKGNSDMSMDKLKSKEGYEVKIANVLYYIFLAIMLGLKGFGLYDGQAVYRIFFWGAMLCAAGKIFLTDYTKKEWMLIVVFGILSVIIERNSGEKGVLITYAVVAGMKNISLNRILQIATWIYGITVGIMITYYGVFLEKSTYIIHERLGMGDVIRYGLGYAHPNTLMVTYFVCCTLIIISLGKRYDWKHAVVLFGGLIYLYSYCISYTALITVTMVIVLPLYLIKIRKSKLGIVEYVIGGAVLPFCLIYSFVSPFYMPEKIWMFFEKYLATFTMRLKLAKQYVIPANISLFGTHVTKVTDSSFTLDNSFLYSFIFEGVLFFGVIIILYFYMIHRLIKEKRNLELIITCVFLVYAIMESFMFNTSFKNITLFFLGEVLWSKSEYVEEKFDRIKIAVPDYFIKEMARVWECLKRNRRKIYLICGVCGIVVFAVCVLNNILMDSMKRVTMATLRESMAKAWFAVVLVALAGVLILTIQYIYKKRKDIG